MHWMITHLLFSCSNQHMHSDYYTYFEKHNHNADWAEFNAFKIIKKYWDLI